MRIEKDNADNRDQNEISEFLQGFIERCKSLEVLLDETWKNLILGNTKDAMVGLANIFTYLEKVFNQVEILNNYQVVKINSSEIIQKIGALEGAMLIPDYILIADLIKYEIKPVIVGWRKSVWTAMKQSNSKLN